jgi:hypothetical protein
MGQQAKCRHDSVNFLHNSKKGEHFCGNYLVFYRHENDTAYVVGVVYGKRDYLKILFGDLPEEE